MHYVPSCDCLLSIFIIIVIVIIIVVVSNRISLFVCRIGSSRRRSPTPTPPHSVLIVLSFPLRIVIFVLFVRWPLGVRLFYLSLYHVVSNLSRLS